MPTVTVVLEPIIALKGNLEPGLLRFVARMQASGVQRRIERVTLFFGRFDIPGGSNRFTVRFTTEGENIFLPAAVRGVRNGSVQRSTNTCQKRFFSNKRLWWSERERYSIGIVVCFLTKLFLVRKATRLSHNSSCNQDFLDSLKPLPSMGICWSHDWSQLFCCIHHQNH